MTYIKICGITNLADARTAVEAGADMLGFVFFPRSPRYIEPARAAEIIATLRRSGSAPRFVGVFVNESLERTRAIAAATKLDAVQLHGDESPEMLRELSAPLPHEVGERKIDVIKALRPRSATEADSLVARYRLVACGTPAFIVDAFDAQRFGGTGRRAEWEIAAQIALEFPILLAGGLDADNVADAICAVRPWGVDVSSGVERAPGRKDHDKVWQFVQIAKEAK